MTRRSSVRAAARENYAAMVQAKARAEESAATPGRSPRFADARGEGETNDLTARVRALYEDSATPVRDIARLCGVTERTIYKYAAKGAWQPRYRWRTDGTRPAAFAPVKGAGGRFIRRDDRDTPFASGLKATDPAAAARAVAACEKASRLARAAFARAQAQARRAARPRAIDALNGALAAYARYRQDLEHAATLNSARRAKAPTAPPPPAQVYRPGTGWEPSKERVRIPPSARPPRRSPVQAAIEHLHLRHVEVALTCWQNLLADASADRRR